MEVMFNTVPGKKKGQRKTRQKIIALPLNRQWVGLVMMLIMVTNAA